MKKNKTYTEIFIDYPVVMCFKTQFEFENDEERTKYLHKILKKNKVDSPLHDYTDYIVEATKKINWNADEVWIIGS
jgi:hypothetical protein